MTPTVDDDLELWERAKRDTAAREELSSLVHAVALSELKRRGYGADERDEFAQETVLTILGYLDRDGEVRKNLRGFVQYRVRGVLSDHRKRRQRGPAADIEPDLLPGSGDGPGARLMSEELKSALEHCHGELSAAHRVVLELRCRDGLGAGEIAERLGLERGTVNTRASRALDRIRDCLERKGFDTWFR